MRSTLGALRSTSLGPLERLWLIIAGIGVVLLVISDVQTRKDLGDVRAVVCGEQTTRVDGLDPDQAQRLQDLCRDVDQPGRDGRDGRDGRTPPPPATPATATPTVIVGDGIDGLDGADGQDGIARNGRDGQDGRDATQAQVNAAVDRGLEDALRTVCGGSCKGDPGTPAPPAQTSGLERGIHAVGVDLDALAATVRQVVTGLCGVPLLRPVLAALGACP